MPSRGEERGDKSQYHIVKAGIEFSISFGFKRLNWIPVRERWLIDISVEFEFNVEWQEYKDWLVGRHNQCFPLSLSVELQHLIKVQGQTRSGR